jgi:hypothetical protein
VSEKLFHFNLTGCKVENELCELWSLLATEEWMFFFKIDVDVVLGTTEASDDAVAVFSFFFPGVHVMENHVTWGLKPLNLVRALAVSFHDTIS